VTSESSEDRVIEWLRGSAEDLDADVEELVAIMRAVSPADFFSWKSTTMKKVLIAVDSPLESYEKGACIEAVLKFFQGTPVLQRSPQLTPRAPASDQISEVVATGLSGVARGAAEEPPAAHITMSDLKALMREQMGEFKGEVEALRGEFLQVKNSKKAGPVSRDRQAAKVVPESGWNASAPKVSDLFAAVEHATRARFGEDGESDEDGDDAVATWTFDSPTFPGGRHVARKISAEKPRRHARKGGEEDLYRVSKEKFYPFRSYMLARKSDWQNNSLFREGLTDASVLDQLALLPASMDKQEALMNAREMLVRRWLCLKSVAKHTTRLQTPKFTNFALGFESLMVVEADIPDAALRTALANSKYAQKMDKARREE
jgi:hypothetical protein